jgi:arylsulfatase A-like enzyme
MKVLVVVARGLQAGALSCYGNSWIEAPNLDFLASEGIVFDQHIADAVQADAVRRVWRSGRYHLPAMQGPDPAPVAAADLIEVLRGRQIHTCLIRDDSHPAPPAFELDWDQVQRVPAPPPDSEDTPLVRTLEAARAALQSLADRDQWLLWIELAAPLPPWDVPEDFRQPYFSPAVANNDRTDGEDEDAIDNLDAAEGEADEFESDGATEVLEPIDGLVEGNFDPHDDSTFLRLQSSYAAAVSYFDAGVGQLLEDLGDGADEILILITADGGQALGEHGFVGPGQSWLHEEVVHLPLILRLPGGAEAGRRVAALTQPVDLAATLADVFEVPLPDAHGHSLVSLMQGDAEVLRPYACAGNRVGTVGEWCLRTLEWSFLMPALLQDQSATPRSPQLYIKPDDRWEVNNIAQHEPELVDRLERALRAFVAAAGERRPLVVPALDEGGGPPTAV